MTASVAKTAAGRFFPRTFASGGAVRHPTPHTLTSGDASLYSALHGAHFRTPKRGDFRPRHRLSDSSPIDDLLAFHVVFGKTVADVSLNAVANLGFSDCRFSKPVFAGDTLCGVVGGDRA